MPSITFQVTDKHPCYDAHFPSAPVVPGALLLYWLQEMLRAEGLASVDVVQLKFLRPVFPGQSCTLEYRLLPDKLVAVGLASADGSCLKGKLRLKNE